MKSADKINRWEFLNVAAKITFLAKLGIQEKYLGKQDFS